MKILEYAKHIRKSAHIQHTVSNYAENEWHNVSEDFFLDLTNRSAFATRIVPIHNGNGYQGNVYQFLWRANMDYYNLLPIETQTSEQPMQPATTDYAAQLSAVKTLPELFDFRAKLKAEREEFSKTWYDEGAQANSAHLKNRHEAQFFIDRAESQIKALENDGFFLAAVDGRGIVGALDLTLEKAVAVETLVENSAGIIAEAALSPIEEKAKVMGKLGLLRKLQDLANENEWVFPCGDFDNSEFSSLHSSKLVVKLDIYEADMYAYLWRHEMDYENFFQIKNPPKN